MPPFGGPDFARVLALVRRQIGIEMPDNNYRSIARTLERRQGQLGLSGAEYVGLLEADPAEQERFLNAVTIGETYFFREEKQFKVLKEMVFPRLPTDRNKRIWSATCASGEEALSLALLADDFFGVDAGRNVTIHATDIDSDSLEVFRAGQYGKNSFRKDGESFWHLLNLRSDGSPVYSVPEGLSKRLRVSRINLYLDSLEHLPNDFDLVFFRNTLIYFEEDVKRLLIEKLVSRIRMGGFFFVSISEVHAVRCERLRLLEKDNIFFFEKTAPPENAAPPVAFEGPRRGGGTTER